MGQSLSPHHHTVVIVDDEEELRETLVEVLAEEGYRVFTAENGETALRLLEKVPEPCLLLVDLMMPVLDGFQFLQRLQERGSNTPPVLVITAHASSEQTKNLPGVLGILRKPFDLSRLLEAVHRHCPHRGVFPPVANPSPWS